MTINVAVPTLFAWKVQFSYPNTGGSTVSGAIGPPLEVQDCTSFQCLDVSQIRVRKKGGVIRKVKAVKDEDKKEIIPFSICLAVHHKCNRKEENQLDATVTVY